MAATVADLALTAVEPSLAPSPFFPFFPQATGSSDAHEFSAELAITGAAFLSFLFPSLLRLPNREQSRRLSYASTGLLLFPFFPLFSPSLFQRFSGQTLVSGGNPETLTCRMLGVTEDFLSFFSPLFLLFSFHRDE